MSHKLINGQGHISGVEHFLILTQSQRPSNIGILRSCFDTPDFRVGAPKLLYFLSCK